MTLTRDDSSIAKGAAILLMMIHHLFAFPERIPVGFEYHSILPHFRPEFQIGVFGRLCVGLFLFLSGFGFGAKPAHEIAYSCIKRAAAFYRVYIVNLVLLIGIAYFFFNPLSLQYPDWSYSLSFSASTILQNVFLLSTSCCPEWWFARLYILAIFFIYPVCEIFCRKRVSNLIMVSILAYLVAVSTASHTSPKFFHDFNRFLFRQITFVCGFVLSRYPAITVSIRGWVPEWLTSMPALPRNGLLLLFVFFVHQLLGTNLDVLLAPLFIIGFLPLSKQFHCDAAFAFLGKHSASMWMNHTFICYYFFPKQIYGLKNPLLILAVLGTTSLILAVMTAPMIRLLTHLTTPLGSTVRRVIGKFAPQAGAPVQ